MLQQLEKTETRKRNKQIEKRKVDQQNLNIEPYRSHRKRQSQLTVLQPLVNQSSNLPDGAKYKLSRDYPSDPLLSNSTQKTQRFSYEIAKQSDFIVDDELSYGRSNFKKVQNASKLRDVQVSNRKKQIYMQTPFSIGSFSQSKEIRSIMFSSKIEPFDSRMSSVAIQQIQIGNNRQINTFKLKVEKVNNQIEAGISNLQRLIEKLKVKKKQQKQSKASLTKFQERQHKMPVPAEIVKNAILVQDVNHNNSNFKNKSFNKAPQISKQELKGSIKAYKFPPEYTTLINRLATQIEIDIQFTNTIANLCKNSSIQAVKNLVTKQLKRNAQVDLDETFFIIEQSQIDPLQIIKPQTKAQLNIQQVTQLSMQLYRKYKQIQHHFASKLKHSFQANIISLLFEQIGIFSSRNINRQEFKTVTVGHLLSYINMRANKAFRNRAFVKMGKRIGIKHNSSLTPALLQIFIKVI